ncbi:MAG: NAD(P)/FAD-dependent oxidoreductase [Minisyncoccia bacterium]
MKKKNLVILGAGFGGMYAYKSLSKKVFDEYNVTIIDKNNHFLFTPLLHEVATGSLGALQVVEPIRALLRKNASFLQSEVIKIDTEKKEIITTDSVVSYDIVISALGAKNNYFNIPGTREYCYSLKTLRDAKKLKNRFIQQFECASREPDPEKRKQILSFAIVGAGPTGVELAGETADLFFNTFEKYYHDFYCFDEVSLFLVNGGSTILNTFPKKLQKHATKELKKNHVQIKNNTRVVEVSKNSLKTNTGEDISADTIVWTAGVSAQDLSCVGEVFDIQKTRISVDEYLQVKHKNIFVVGDMAHVSTKDGQGYPMTAQVAKQQGVLVGKNISRVLANKKPKKFTYNERGMLASLGNHNAIARIFGVTLYGPIAWFVWRTIYLVNFISWRKRFKIVLDWTVNLFSERDITYL